MTIPSWLTVNTDFNEYSNLTMTIMDGRSDAPDVYMALSSNAELAIVNAVSPIYRPDRIDGLEVNSLLERRDKVASIMAGDLGSFELLFCVVESNEVTPEEVATTTDKLIAAALNSLS